MSEAEKMPEDQVESTHEMAAHSIHERFPSSTLQINESKAGKIFEIYSGEKLLLIFDKKGVRYLFPTRRRRIVKWERVTSLGLPRVIEHILRDLAEADYEVMSTTNKPILKRPVHISRYMRCPVCKEPGALRIILRGEPAAEEESQIYTYLPRELDLNGAEIRCISCLWIGIRGQLNRRRSFKG